VNSERHRRPPGRVIRLAAAALTLLASAGCGVLAGADPASAPDGVLTFATNAQPECLDPQVSPLDVTALVDRSVFDSLVSMTPDGKFHPWLATSWTVSPDQRTYTFHLRHGVVFHDSAPFDASAVKATLDHAVDPKTRSKYAARLVRGYTGATVLDADTVQVALSRPDASFLQALSTAYLGIQSPKSLSQNANNLCERPVGSGPLRFVSWDHNSKITLTRYDAYDWGPASAAHTGPTALRGVVFRFVTDDSVRFGMLASGQADMVDFLPNSKVATVRRSDALHVYRAPAPGAVYQVYFNVSHGPLADERVRQAVRASIDLDALVKAVTFGQFQRAWSPLGPATLGYDPQVVGSWQHDPALAGRLLDEAGWTGRDAEGFRTKNGVRLSLLWPYSPRVEQPDRQVLAQGIQAEVKQAGIDLSFVPTDAGKLGDEVVKGNLDIFDNSFERAEPDILRYIYSSKETPANGGGNLSYIASPELDGWLDAAVATSDPATRAAAYGKAQQYLVQHAVALPIWVPEHIVGALSRVRGLSFSPEAQPLFYDVSLASS